MRIALIKDGEVKNIIEASQKFADQIKSQWDAVIKLPQGSAVSIGWTFDGQNLISNGAGVPIDSPPEILV